MPCGIGVGRGVRSGAECGYTLGYGLQCRMKGGDIHDAVRLAFGNPAQVGSFGENDKTLHFRHPELLALCVLLQMSIKLDIYLTCILRDLLHRRRAVVLPVIIPATIATLDWSLPVFEIDDENTIFREDRKSTRLNSSN